MIDLKALREVAEKATPGPWHIGHISEHEPEIVDIDGSNGLTICKSYGQADSSYLCAANPITILALIDRLERYEKALKYYAGFTMNAPSPECPYCKIEPYSNCHALGKKAREALGDVDAGLLTTEEWKKMNEGCT